MGKVDDKKRKTSTVVPAPSPQNNKKQRQNNNNKSPATTTTTTRKRISNQKSAAAAAVVAAAAASSAVNAQQIDSEEDRDEHPVVANQSQKNSMKKRKQHDTPPRQHSPVKKFKSDHHHHHQHAEQSLPSHSAPRSVNQRKLTHQSSSSSSYEEDDDNDDDDDDDDSQSEHDDEEGDEEEDDDDQEMQYHEEEEEGVEELEAEGDEESRVQDNSGFPKKLTKSEKKQLLREKKSHSKLHFQAIYQAKQVWETLRRRDPELVPTDERSNSIDRIMKLIKGHIFDVARKQDASRILQTCLKFGSQQQKNDIMEELKGQIVVLISDQYSHWLVKKLVKYGNANIRQQVISELSGKIRKLIVRKEAAKVIDYVYTEFASASQKCDMLQEFYGDAFRLFKTDIAKSLDEILTQNPDKKEVIMHSMTKILQKILDKAMLDHEIIHHLLVDFFRFGAYSEISWFIETLREAVVHILHTKDGAKVGVYCISHGTAKDRKEIIKHFKTHVIKAATESNGHMVVCRLLNVVDDTKLLNDVILEELRADLIGVATNKFAYRVLLQILTPGDSRYFSPQHIQLFSEGLRRPVSQKYTDETGQEQTRHIWEPTSKKSADIRRQELLAYLSPDLLRMIKKHARQLISDPYGAVILAHSLIQITTDLSLKHECYEEIIEAIQADPDTLRNKTCSFKLKFFIEDEDKFYATKRGQEGEFNEQDEEHRFANFLVKAYRGNILRFVTLWGGDWIVIALLKSRFQLRQQLIDDLTSCIKDLEAFAQRDRNHALLLTVFKEQTGQIPVQIPQKANKKETPAKKVETPAKSATPAKPQSTTTTTTTTTPNKLKTPSRRQ